jgi:acyl-coenzyme A thioesterase PaaI-like protein
MGEIDEEQEAKQAKQRQDDEAEAVVHQQHVQVRGGAMCLHLDFVCGLAVRSQPSVPRTTLGAGYVD